MNWIESIPSREDLRTCLLYVSGVLQGSDFFYDNIQSLGSLASVDSWELEPQYSRTVLPHERCSLDVCVLNVIGSERKKKMKLVGYFHTFFEKNCQN